MKKRSCIQFGSGRAITLLLIVLMEMVLPYARSQSRAAVEMNVSEEYLKAAADAERAPLGLPPLKVDVSLAAAARQHAAVMVGHDSISHKYAEEPDLAARAATAGARFSLISENVAQAPNAVKIQAAWMHSEGHRHNLLDPNVDSIGISVMERHGQLFAVEDFARIVAQLSFRQQEGVVAKRLQPFRLSLLAADDEARQICIDGRNSDGARTPDFTMRYTTADLDMLPDQLLPRLQSGRYASAAVAACAPGASEEFTMYRVAVLLFR